MRHAMLAALLIHSRPELPLKANNAHNSATSKYFIISIDATQ
jgi:hypothetical protein